MSRYIDADKLESELFRDGIAGIFLNYPRRVKFTIGEIRGMLKNERIAPTADVVEVVRCKDCKFNVANMQIDENDVTDYSGEDIVCSYFMTDGLEPNDYCSYGERSENGKS